MIDYEKLKDIFPFIQGLSQEDIFNFLKHIQLKVLRQGEIFLEPGSMKSNVYFVKSGLIRSYYVNEKGEEITNRIRYENQVMSCYEIDLLKQPARYTLQAIEPTELLVIELATMKQIVHGNPKYETGLRFFLTDSLLQALQLIDDFMLLTPEERYIKFVKNHPELLNRVPNKYIANVLGITPVSLSRIRKRITLKKQ
jgi:CRP-like cAMP-binding protein